MFLTANPRIEQNGTTTLPSSDTHRRHWPDRRASLRPSRKPEPRERWRRIAGGSDQPFANEVPGTASPKRISLCWSSSETRFVLKNCWVNLAYATRFLTPERCRKAGLG